MHNSGNNVVPGSPPLCNVSGSPVYMTGVKIRTFSPVCNGNYANMHANKMRKNVNGYLTPVVPFLGQRRFPSGAKRIGKKEYVRSVGQPNRLKSFKQYRCVAKGWGEVAAGRGACHSHGGEVRPAEGLPERSGNPGGGPNGGLSGTPSGYLNGHPRAEMSGTPAVSSRVSDKTRQSYKAAGYFIVKTEVEQNAAANANQETNKRNINVKILLGYDPLKKQPNSRPLIETDGGPQMKGELNIPGGKKDQGECNPVVTAYREFSEESIYLYNMFVAYFSHLHYVMKGIAPGGRQVEKRPAEERQVEKRPAEERQVERNPECSPQMELTPYELSLRRNFLTDVTEMSIEEKKRAINLHINNFMLYFKEVCLDIKENHEAMYRCSYPPSYHEKRSATLERIHKEVSLLSSIENDEVNNFKLYYAQGKYSLFFYNAIQYHCKNMLHYLRNYFWHNYTTFFYILLHENMNFLIRCRGNSRTNYEPYLFDSGEIKKKIDPDLYHNLMHVENLIPSEYGTKKRDTFYGEEGASQKGEGDSQMDTGYMNDMIWLDLSDLLLYLLRSCSYVGIVRHVWSLFDEIMQRGGDPVGTSHYGSHREDYHHEEAESSHFVLVGQGSLKLHRSITAKVWHLYKDMHRRLHMLIQHEEYDAFWALFFSPFNTKLSERNVGTLRRGCGAPFRKFLNCLVTSRDFWVFLFLNLVGSIPGG
ncbi:conserved Plasmodium protein, unknown function [Plasmodium vivax]|uniref:Nudix hydrolase domain-containing protein n=1 Tax=Plasmodium vivax TaxID=5855 RepID=A0A1G4GYW2_PLAVI|nr:conserved Plasmodium protein, unknown function [Plasmodium vivax]